MDKTVLQIPVSKNLRLRAEKTAINQGFSSLQEIIRVFMNKLATKTIDVTFKDAVVLSPQAEKRYAKMDHDFKSGKNVYIAKNASDLMKQLAKQ